MARAASVRQSYGRRKSDKRAGRAGWFGFAPAFVILCVVAIVAVGVKDMAWEDDTPAPRTRVAAAPAKQPKPAAPAPRRADPVEDIAVAQAKPDEIAKPADAFKPGTTLTGPAKASDGDTLRMGEVRIRLAGIDAPELAQTCRDQSGADIACGKLAANALANLIDKRTVVCTAAGTDKYKRTLASCTVGEGHQASDLAGTMVMSGWAVADRQHSTRYVAAEEAAHNAGRGLWATAFQMPDAYRRLAKAGQ